MDNIDSTIQSPLSEDIVESNVQQDRVLQLLDEIETFENTNNNLSIQKPEILGEYYEELGYLQYIIQDYESCKYSLSKAIDILKAYRKENNELLIDTHYIFGKALMNDAIDIKQKETAKNFMMKVRLMRQSFDDGISNLSTIEEDGNDEMIISTSVQDIESSPDKTIKTMASRTIDSTFVYYDLADESLNLGEIELASNFMLKCLKLRREKFPNEYESNIFLLPKYTEILIKQKLFVDAFITYKAYLEVLLKKFGTIHQLIAEANRELGRLALLTYDYDASIEFYESALKMEFELQVSSLSIIQLYHHLIEVYRVKCDFIKALQVHDDILQYYQDHQISEDEVDIKDLEREKEITLQKQLIFSNKDIHSMDITSPNDFFKEKLVKCDLQHATSEDIDDIINHANLLVLSQRYEEALEVYHIATDNESIESHDSLILLSIPPLKLSFFLKNWIDIAIEYIDSLYKLGNYQLSLDVINETIQYIQHFTHEMELHDSSILYPIDHLFYLKAECMDILGQSSEAYRVLKTLLEACLGRIQNPIYLQLVSTKVFIIDIRVLQMKCMSNIGSFDEAEVVLTLLEDQWNELDVKTSDDIIKGFNKKCLIVSKRDLLSDIDTYRILVYLHYLLIQFSLSYHRGNYHLAKQSCDSLHNLSLKIFQDTPNEYLAHCYEQFGLLHILYGNLNEAYDYFSKAMVMFKTLYHIYHYTIGRCQTYLGLVSLIQYQLPKALEYIQLGYDCLILSLPLHQHDVCMNQLYLAKLYLIQGDINKSHMILTQSLVFIQKTNDLDVSYSLSQESMTFMNEMNELEVNSSISNANTNTMILNHHPITSSCMITYGDILSTQGHVNQALEQFNEAWSLMNRYLSPSIFIPLDNNYLGHEHGHGHVHEQHQRYHIDLIYYYLSRSSNLIVLGEYIEALELLEKNYQYCQQLISNLLLHHHPINKEHYLLNDCRLALATIYSLIENENIHTAYELASISGISSCQIYGEDSSKTSDCFLLLAYIAFLKGLYHDTKSFLSKCLSIRKKLYSEEHVKFIQTLLVSTLNSKAPGNYTIAMKTLKGVLLIVDKIYEDDVIYRLILRILECSIMYESGQVILAEENLQQVLIQMKQIINIQSFHFVTILYHIGECFRIQQKYKIALRTLKQGLDVLIQLYENSSIHSSLILANFKSSIAYCLFAMNRSYEAVILLQNEVLPIYELIIGNDHPLTIHARGRLGLCLNTLVHGTGEIMIHASLDLFQVYSHGHYSSNHPWVLELGGYKTQDHLIEDEEETNEEDEEETNEEDEEEDANEEDELKEHLAKQRLEQEEQKVHDIIAKVPHHDVVTNQEDDTLTSNQIQEALPLALVHPMKPSPMKSKKRNKILEAMEFLYKRSYELYSNDEFQRSLTLLDECYETLQTNESHGLLISNVLYLQGQCLLQLGKYDLSYEKFQASKSLRQDIDGFHSKSVGEVYLALGHLCYLQSQYHQSEKDYQVGLEMLQLSESHEMLSKGYIHYSYTLLSLGRFTKALDIMENAKVLLDPLLDNPPSDNYNPLLGQSEYLLAKCEWLYTTGQYKQANEVMNEILILYVTNEYSNGLRYWNTLFLQAKIILVLGQVINASTIFQDVLDNKLLLLDIKYEDDEEETLYQLHPFILEIRCYQLQVDSTLAKGNFDVILASQVKVYQIQLQVYFQHSLILIDILVTILDSLFQLGYYEQTNEYIHKLKDMNESYILVNTNILSLDSHPYKMYLEALYKYYTSYYAYAIGNYHQCLDGLDEAMVQFQLYYPSDNTNPLRVYQCIYLKACCYIHLKANTKAIEGFNRCVDIIRQGYVNEQQEESNHPYYANCLMHLAYLIQQQGEDSWSEARKLMNQAIKIYKESYQCDCNLMILECQYHLLWFQFQNTREQLNHHDLQESMNDVNTIPRDKKGVVVFDNSIYQQMIQDLVSLVNLMREMYTTTSNTTSLRQHPSILRLRGDIAIIKKMEFTTKEEFITCLSIEDYQLYKTTHETTTTSSNSIVDMNSSNGLEELRQVIQLLREYPLELSHYSIQRLNEYIQSSSSTSNISTSEVLETFAKIDNIFALAEQQRYLGSYHQANAYYDEALAMELKILTPMEASMHLLVGNTIYGKAECCRCLGWYSLGRSLYGQCISIYRRVSNGIESHETMKACFGLAELLCLQGNYEEAMKLHQQILFLRNQVVLNHSKQLLTTTTTTSSSSSSSQDDDLNENILLLESFVSICDCLLVLTKIQDMQEILAKAYQLSNSISSLYEMVNNQSLTSSSIHAHGIYVISCLYKIQGQLDLYLGKYTSSYDHLEKALKVRLYLYENNVFHVHVIEILLIQVKYEIELGNYQKAKLQVESCLLSLIKQYGHGKEGHGREVTEGHEEEVEKEEVLFKFQGYAVTSSHPLIATTLILYVHILLEFNDFSNIEYILQSIEQIYYTLNQHEVIIHSNAYFISIYYLQALYYSKISKYKDGLLIASKGLEQVLKVYGSNHIVYFEYLELISYLQLHLSHYDIALGSCSNAMKQLKSLSYFHLQLPIYIKVELQYIHVLILQGHYHEGYSLLINIHSTLLSYPTHPLLIQTYYYQAMICLDMKDYKHANGLLHQSLAIAESLYPKNHLMILRLSRWIGYSLYCLEQYHEAYILLTHIYKQQQLLLGNLHEESLWTWMLISLIYMKQDKYVIASYQLVEGYKIVKRLLGNDHPLLAWLCSSLGDLSVSKQQVVDSLRYYDESIKIWKTCIPSNHLYQTNLLLSKTKVLISQYQLDVAYKSIQEVINIRKTILTSNQCDVSNHILMIEAYEVIGQILYLQCKYHEAKVIFQKTLQMHLLKTNELFSSRIHEGNSLKHQEIHITRHESVYYLALIAFAFGEYQQSLIQLELLIQEMKQYYHHDEKEYALPRSLPRSYLPFFTRVMSSIGSIFNELGYFTKAYSWFHESLELRLEYYHHLHLPYHVDILENIFGLAENLRLSGYFQHQGSAGIQEQGSVNGQGSVGMQEQGSVNRKKVFNQQMQVIDKLEDIDVDHLFDFVYLESLQHKYELTTLPSIKDLYGLDSSLGNLQSMGCISIFHLLLQLSLRYREYKQEEHTLFYQIERGLADVYCVIGKYHESYALHVHSLTHLIRLLHQDTHILVAQGMTSLAFMLKNTMKVFPEMTRFSSIEKILHPKQKKSNEGLLSSSATSTLPFVKTKAIETIETSEVNQYIIKLMSTKPSNDKKVFKPSLVSKKYSKSIQVAIHNVNNQSNKGNMKSEQLEEVIQKIQWTNCLWLVERAMLLLKKMLIHSNDVKHLTTTTTTTSSIQHRKLIFCLFIKADIIRLHNQSQYALPIYERCLQLTRQLNSHNMLSIKEGCESLLTLIYHSYGELYRHEANESMAIAYYEKALELACRLYNRPMSLIESNDAKDDKDIGDLTVKDSVNTITMNDLNAKTNTNAKDDINESILSQHPILADILGHLGMIYYSQGNYKQAEIYFKQCLLIHQQLHHRTYTYAQALHNYGGLLHGLGLLSEAKEVYEESLDMKIQVFGTNQHIEVASTLNNLGLVSKSLNLLSKSLEYYNNALVIQQSLLSSLTSNSKGSLHHQQVVIQSHMASTWNNKASLLVLFDKSLEAMELYHQVIQLKRQLYGYHDISIASVLNNLASLYFQQGNIEQAKELYDESLQIRRKKYGNEHITIAESLNNLGLVYFSYGQLNEALSVYELALDIKMKILTEKHVSVATSMHNLAGLLYKMNRFHDAFLWYQKAYDIRCELLGKDHMDSQSSLMNLMNIKQEYHIDIDIDSNI